MSWMCEIKLPYLQIDLVHSQMRVFNYDKNTKQTLPFFARSL